MPFPFSCRCHTLGMHPMVKEAFDVGLHHPLRPLIGDDLCHLSQRIVRTAARAKAIGAVPKFRLPDGLQNLA